MRIQPYTPSYNVYKTVQKVVPSEKTFSMNKNQSINLLPGQTLNLGTINGQPFNVSLFQDGSYKWSGTYILKAHEETKVTEEEIAAARMIQSYTQEGYYKGQRISSTIDSLYLLANNKMSIDNFNYKMRLCNDPQYGVKKVLEYLGIDAAKPFSINGRKFILDSDVLRDKEK